MMNHQHIWNELELEPGLYLRECPCGIAEQSHISIRSLERLEAENEQLRALLKRMLPDAFWVVKGDDVACVFCGERAPNEGPANGENLKRAFSRVQHSEHCPIVEARALLATTGKEANDGNTP